MERQVKYNIKNVHYAMATENAMGGFTYDTPEPVPGAVTLSMTPDGESTTFYADGVKWYVSENNQGYTGELEAAVIPDKFRVEVLNEEKDRESGVLIENANKETKPFALLFQIDKSDGTPVLFAYYHCTAQRIAVEGKTNERSRSISTDKISLTSVPLLDGTVRTKTTDDTPLSVRQNWFKKVWTKGDSNMIGALEVVCTAGTETGKVAVAVDPEKTGDNTYKVKVGTESTLPAYDEDCTTGDWQDWNGTDELTASVGNTVIVTECTADGRARNVGSCRVTATGE